MLLIVLLCLFPRRFVDVSFEPANQVIIGRPVKKFSSSELDIYLSLVDQADVTNSDLDASVNTLENQSNALSASALQEKQPSSILDNFVASLQETNFQTVSVATQTLEKLSSRAVELSSQDHTTPPQYKFLFGRCRCCFGCMESPISKATALGIWSRKQLELLYSTLLVSSTVPATIDPRLFTEKEGSASQERKQSGEDQMSVLNHIFPYVAAAGSVCIRCARLLISSDTAASIVALLVRSSEQFMSIKFDTQLNKY